MKLKHEAAQLALGTAGWWPSCLPVMTSGAAQVMVGGFLWSGSPQVKNSQYVCTLGLGRQASSCFSSSYSVFSSGLEFSSLEVSVQPCDREQMLAQFAAVKTGLGQSCVCGRAGEGGTHALLDPS